MTRVSQPYIVKYLFHSFYLTIVKLFTKLRETLKLCWKGANSREPNWVTSTEELRAAWGHLLTQANNLPMLRNNVGLELTVFFESVATTHIWMRGWNQVG